MLSLLAKEIQVSLQLRKVLNCFDLLGGCNNASVVCLQTGHPRNDVVLAPRPIFAWVSRQVDFLDVRKLTEACCTLLEILRIDEVDSKIKFLQTFAPLYVLDFRNVVQCDVEVLQLLQLVEVLEPFDDIILEVEDF